MAPLEGLVPGRPSNAQTSCPLQPLPPVNGPFTHGHTSPRFYAGFFLSSPLPSILEANAYMGFLNRKKPVACAVKTSGKAEGGNKP